MNRKIKPESMLSQNQVDDLYRTLLWLEGFHAANPTIAFLPNKRSIEAAYFALTCQPKKGD